MLCSARVSVSFGIDKIGQGKREGRRGRNGEMEKKRAKSTHKLLLLCVCECVYKLKMYRLREKFLLTVQLVAWRCACFPYFIRAVRVTPVCFVGPRDASFCLHLV